MIVFEAYMHLVFYSKMWFAKHAIYWSSTAEILKLAKHREVFREDIRYKARWMANRKVTVKNRQERKRPLTMQ